jgi:TonB family protein
MRAWTLVWVAALGALSAPPARADTPVVAVFALEAKGTPLTPADLDGLADYIEASLAESGRYQVVPQTELRAALSRQKAESYKACYDESCQIEIGKELAAEKSLAGAVTRFGQSCLVTLKLFDLAKATQEAAGTGKGGCDAEGVLASLDSALGKLTGKAAEPVADARPVAPPLKVARVTVPGGAFRFGCDRAKDKDCGPDDPGVREAHLPEFRIDRTEVTVAAFQACVTAGACSAAGLETPRWDGQDRAQWAWACNWNKPGRAEHPINCVDWGQADAFCRWAQGRLPTEAEWEKAARGVDGRTYPWGEQGFGRTRIANIADEAAKRSQPMWFVADGYDDGFYGTAPVGQYPAGAAPSGALDMIGNVTEWTSSWHTPGRLRATRGGGFSTLPDGARVAFRSHGEPTERHETTGFRCVDGPGGDVALAPPPAAPPAPPPSTPPQAEPRQTTRLWDLLAPKPPAGPLDRAKITSVMQGRATELRECKEKGENQRGRVTLEVTVGAEGQVDRVRIKTSQPQVPGTERCLVETVRRFRFSKPASAPFVFTYPIVF